MATSVAVRAGGAGRLRTKTEICVYKTIDGKVIIECEGGRGGCGASSVSVGKAACIIAERDGPRG